MDCRGVNLDNSSCGSSLASTTETTNPKNNSNIPQILISREHHPAVIGSLHVGNEKGRGEVD
jgi:hypothetical protein